jgi:filamentous hemagglutinin
MWGRGQGQFPGIRAPGQFATEIQRIMDNPSASKRLARGRQAYWDKATGTVLIVDPNTIDGGTVFKPASGSHYYGN